MPGARRQHGHITARQSQGKLSTSRIDKQKKTRSPAMDGVRKTVNGHSRLLCCGCSCILSHYVLIWNRTDMQIGIYKEGQIN